MTTSQHHDPEVRKRANTLLAEAGYKVDGMPTSSSFRRKKLVNRVATYLVFACILSVASELILWRDSALSGAQTFTESSPELHNIVGTVHDVSLVKYLAYEGVPGRESPYKQYKFQVKGSSGAVIAIVRASYIGNYYEYRIVEIER